MKPWLSSLLLSLLLLNATEASELKPFKGDPSPPPLKLPDVYGKPHDLADHRGEVVLVNFWPSWCPPCVHEMPSMQRLQDKFAGKPFTILGVNMGEDLETIQAFLGKVQVRFDILMDQDGATLTKWRVYVFPTSFLVDPDGQIRYGVLGAIDWDSEPVITKIEEMLPRVTMTGPAKPE